MQIYVKGGGDSSPLYGSATINCGVALYIHASVAF